MKDKNQKPILLCQKINELLAPFTIGLAKEMIIAGSIKVVEVLEGWLKYIDKNDEVIGIHWF
jgi:hypothetical protein